MPFTGARSWPAMLRRIMRHALLLCTVLVLAGCGSGGSEPEADPAPTSAPRELSASQVKAPPPGSSGALVALPDSLQSRTRLAYVDEARLDAADLELSPSRVRDRVLADGFQTSSEAGIVAIGVDSTEPVAAEDADANALAGHQISAVQACLGDPFAETILGPETMGEGVAMGAGLASSPEDPALVELRLCGVPPVRELHALEKRLTRRFGKLGGVVEEREIRELDLIAATVPAHALEPDQVLALLADPSRQ
ncbi:hypothetical protein OJ997_03180 [Solirubrobacter phytolaccae]|uniref:Lipoprotein n=1 Tax=Solirubrobacter phytolaccae TaxID=1404360 RepID=A0A9X3N3Z1_9ACTN|nr:hypothetical protein [Solirubrobacter phytolaccae]MDA0179288.1 hypothetical protein [Solirubrobacter phytolaccae]